MHSLVFFTAFAASALAIPHFGHLHHLHPARSPKHLLPGLDSIAGRSDTKSLEARESALPVAPFGQCGGDSGYGCAEGFCCSKWGYCGQTQDYCGTGCLFGACSDDSTTPVDPTESVSAITSSNSSTVSVPLPTEINKLHNVVIVTAVNTVTFYGPKPTLQFGPPAVPTTFATQHSPLSSSSTNVDYVAPTPIWSAPEPSSTHDFVPPTWAPAPTWSAPDSSSADVTTSSAAASTYSAPSASSSSSAPAPTDTSPSGPGLGDTYTMYSGDGTTENGWPDQSSWVSFEDMWAANLDSISNGCTSAPNNSDEENANLKSAIQSVAAESGVDERFILATVMQESTGCVRVPSTGANGLVNPGLMQDHNGAGNCNLNSAPMIPCPADEITMMIKDGTMGTYGNTYDNGVPGDGLQQLLQQATSNDVSKYYKAARLYNSGSFTSIKDLAVGGATPCYCSDIANRLTGWVKAPSQCTLLHGY